MPSQPTRPTSGLEGVAAKLGVPYVSVALRRGVAGGGKWVCPEMSTLVSVEEAVLSSFRLDGWRGYCREGGLILNLIKAMSFDRISLRHRATYIEALYAQNVAFEQDRFASSTLLSTVAKASRSSVETNFDIMASRESVTEKYRGFSSTSNTSMLDLFPGLERWMFVELFEVGGIDLIHRIASKFTEAPYDYRRGWPDITMWRDRELRFVEVKAPGDKLHKSQKTIITEFAKPLGLNFAIAGVIEAP